MIPKEYRLKKDRNFDILFKEGKYISGEGVDIKHWKIDTEKYPERFNQKDLKIGFIISTDISNKATIRNRKKRQMREATRKLLKNKDFKKGYLIALIANDSILSMQFEEIYSYIESLFKKTDIIS